MNADRNHVHDYKPNDGQYKKLLAKLRAYPYKRNGIVPFPIVYMFSGSYLKFSKDATVELFSVSVHRPAGVKLLFWNS